MVRSRLRRRRRRRRRRRQSLHHARARPRSRAFAHSCTHSFDIHRRALVVVAIQRELGSIFTSDPKLLDVFEEIRVPLATTVFTMNAAVVFERVPMAMGRTRAVLILGFAGSWAVWKSTSELGRRGQTSEFCISVKSKSIRLIFGRIDCSRRVLEAQPKSLRRNCRICAH